MQTMSLKWQIIHKLKSIMIFKTLEILLLNKNY